MRPPRVINVLLVSVVCTCCSTTATIYRQHEPDVEADIVGGSRENLIVESKSGQRFSIPRSEVRDIDHPGDLHVILGGLLLGYGAFNIAVGWEHCQHGRGLGKDGEQTGYCVGMVGPAVTGALMALWGLIVYDNSTTAVDDTSAREPRQSPAPGAQGSAVGPRRAYVLPVTSAVH